MEKSFSVTLFLFVFNFKHILPVGVLSELSLICFLSGFLQEVKIHSSPLYMKISLSHTHSLRKWDLYEGKMVSCYK